MLDQFPAQLDLVESAARGWIAEYQQQTQSENGMNSLCAAMAYSFLSGGKRTRPVLGLLVAEAMGVHPQRVLPFVLAVEMIHTYSLIHDDLPCMDDDDERRGRPTNHVVYGENVALLAGDTLLTEAFGFLARAYHEEPTKGLAAVQLLSEAAGFWGMAGGQALDLMAQKVLPGKDAILDMHARKTGALFRVICEGVAAIAGAPAEIQSDWRDFGAALGLCFQLADDVLDSQQELEKGSLPDLIGLAATIDFLNVETQRARDVLQRLGVQSGPLVEIVKWNQSRKI